MSKVLMKECTECTVIIKEEENTECQTFKTVVVIIGFLLLIK